MAKLNLDRPLADPLRAAAVDRLAALWGDGPLGRLVARVALLLEKDEAWDGLRSRRDVGELFRSRGLIPGAIVARIEALARTAEASLVASWPADEIAVSFAACLFPQRASHLEEDEFAGRFALWLSAVTKLRGLACGSSDESLAWARLVPSLASLAPTLGHRTSEPNQLSELFDDLTGASLLSDQKTPAAEQERRDRRVGSLLHLATYKPESMLPLLDRRQQTAPALRFFRRSAPMLPSRLALSDRSRAWPSWEALTRKLASFFPSVEPESLATVVRLEKMTWNEACRWLPAALVEEGAADFWELTWAKLASGFPYFGFRSSLPTWWKQCLTRHRWRVRRNESIDDDLPGEPDSPGELLSLDLLQQARELYRVVRATFYHPKPKDPAQDNERRRRLIDALWQGRIENMVEGDLPKTLLAEVHARFPEVTESVLNNMSHHLRMRFFAARLARFQRLTIAEIRSAPPDDALRHSVDASKPPLEDAPALEGLVSLVKAAAPGQTLLGPLTAHFAHGSQIEPRWKDPWTFPRYVGELWSWTSALAGEDTEGRENSPLEAALREIRSSEEWPSLASQLAQASDQESVDRLVASQSWDGPRDAARQALARALGPRTLDHFEPKQIKRWRKTLGTGKSYWMVPVWYLTVVERLEQTAIVERLAVDRQEVESVVALHRTIAEDCLADGHHAN